MTCKIEEGDLEGAHTTVGTLIPHPSPAKRIWIYTDLFRSPGALVITRRLYVLWD
jgi:hypothetical protein